MLMVTRTKAVLPVLIDTWWNVNLCTHNANFFYRQVLIDTWWNVNPEWLTSYIDHSAF